MRAIAVLVTGLALAACVSKDVTELADEQRRYECRFVTDTQEYVQCLKYGPEDYDRRTVGVDRHKDGEY